MDAQEPPGGGSLRPRGRSLLPTPRTCTLNQSEVLRPDVQASGGFLLASSQSPVRSWADFPRVRRAAPGWGARSPDSGSAKRHQTVKKFRAVPSQGPEATSRHRPAGRRLGAGHRQGLQAAHCGSPGQVSPQTARKETVKAFWSRPPEACLCWGGQREGGRGRERQRRKQRRDKGPVHL